MQFTHILPVEPIAAASLKNIITALLADLLDLLMELDKILLK